MSDDNGDGRAHVIRIKGSRQLRAAAMAGLKSLESAREVARRRGISINDLFGIEGRNGKDDKNNADQEPDRKPAEA